MSLETAIAELRLCMSALGIASLTVEAVASAASSPAPPIQAQRKRTHSDGRWSLSGNGDSIGDVILRVMAQGDPMTMSHIHKGVSDDLGQGHIPARGTVRSVVWSMQQAGLVVEGDDKAPSLSGRRSKTYRRVLPD